MENYGELWRMLENIEILNIKQQKGKEVISFQNQMIILQSFSYKICWQKKWKKLKYLRIRMFI